MANKKITVSLIVMIIVSMFSVTCFAEEMKKDSPVTIGNEIKSSIDKTGKSISNVIYSNSVKNVVKDEKHMVENTTGAISSTVYNVTNRADDMMRDGYNTTKTATETENYSAVSQVSATTWMWIILIAAAVVVIAAIWYYATQEN